MEYHRRFPDLNKQWLAEAHLREVQRRHMIERLMDAKRDESMPLQ